MSDIKAELERKKAALQALREEKRRKEEARLKISKPPDGNSTNINENLRAEAEKMLKELGIEPKNGVAPKASDLSEDKTQTPGKGKRKLVVSVSSEFSVAPQVKVSYDKEIQTIVEKESRDHDHSLDYYVPSFLDEWDEEDLNDPRPSLSGINRLPDMSSIKAGSSHHAIKSLHNSLHNGPDTTEFEELQEQPSMPTMSEEEINQTMLSAGFVKFFNRSSQLMERMLCMKDEAAGTKEAELLPSTPQSPVTLDRQFYDEQWCKNRVISSLDWSTHHPELMLAAYQSVSGSSHESSGQCLLWNMLYRHRQSPEYRFTCASPVTSACLARFHPSLVIGGTQSGQMVIWDTRANKSSPVRRSLLSPSLTHPVFSVQVVGTQNSNNIVSLSADGSLHTWAVDNLQQPVESKKVLDSHTGMYDVFPTCMSFFANDVNNFAVGSENTNIYTDQRHSSRSGGTKHESPRNTPFQGHSSPVTSISCHPIGGEINFSYLFLTSSLDWTTRLWSGRERRLLHTFGDSFECVYDVQWSPLNPALFATADGNGQVNFWDLNKSFEAPSVTKRIGVKGDADACEAGLPQVVAQKASTASKVMKAGEAGPAIGLNKLSWNASGRLLAVGDVAGRVHVYELHESFAKPRPTAWTDLSKQLTEMRSCALDQEHRGPQT